MEGNYCEARAIKQKTSMDTAQKVLIVLGIVVLVFLSLAVSSVIWLLVIAAGVFAYWYIPQLNVVYEYVFVDGQLDFDKILNGEKRKHVDRVDMDQVVVVAPRNSHSLDGYRHSGVKVVDFSSGAKDAKIFGLVVTAGEQSKMYLFEPDEVMLQKMHQKSPRKVLEY